MASFNLQLITFTWSPFQREMNQVIKTELLALVRVIALPSEHESAPKYGIAYLHISANAVHEVAA
jgi:hypothetical protein